MHLIDHIIFYNFYLLVRKVYQLIKFITQSYVFIAFEFIFIHIYCLSKKPQKAPDGLLQVSSQQIFSVNKLYYVVFQSFYCIQLFHIFLDVQVFQDPGFSGSRFFWAWVQGLSPGFRSSPCLPIVHSSQIEGKKFYGHQRKNYAFVFNRDFFHDFCIAKNSLLLSIH